LPSIFESYAVACVSGISNVRTTGHARKIDPPSPKATPQGGGV